MCKHDRLCVAIKSNSTISINCDLMLGILVKLQLKVLQLAGLITFKPNGGKGVIHLVCSFFVLDVKLFIISIKMFCIRILMMQW